MGVSGFAVAATSQQMCESNESPHRTPGRHTVFFVNYISGKLGEKKILLKYRKRLMKNDYVQEAGIERYLRGWKTRL